jgi:hypothetical protein
MYLGLAGLIVGALFLLAYIVLMALGLAANVANNAGNFG